MKPVLQLFLLLLPFSIMAETQKVGWILPLTGPIADYGESMKNAVLLAEKDDPELFKGLENIFEDAQNDPVKGVAAFQKLKDTDRVKITAVFGVAHCQALAPLAEKYQQPTVGLCISADSARNRKYYFLGMNPYDDYMVKQVAFLQQKGIKDIALVEADHSYINSYVESFKRNLAPGMQVKFSENYPLTEQDFRTAIFKIKTAGYPAVGVFLYAGQIASFLKQAHSVGLHPLIFGTNIFESLSEIKAAEGRMEGSVYPFERVNPDWRQRFGDIYHKTSQISFGAISYETARIIATAFKNRPKSADEIMQTLKALPEQTGIASGPYQLVTTPDNLSYIRYPIIMKQVKGEGYIDLTE